MLETIGSTSGLICSLFVVYHDLEYGYKDNTISFIGINGARHFVGNFREEMKNVPEFNKMINRKFPEAKKNLEDQIQNFYEKFKTAKIPSCQTGSHFPDISPGVANSLTPQITKAVNKEITALIRVGDSIDGSSRVIKYLAKLMVKDTEGKKVADVVDQMVGYLNLGSNAMNEFRNDLLEKADFTNLGKNLNFFLLFFSFGILILILSNFFIIFLSMKFKEKKSLGSFTKLGISCQFCLGGLISGISLVMMLITILVVNGCYFTDQTLKDKTYLDGVLNERFHNISSKCLYNDSMGDLTEELGDLVGDQKSLDELIDGLENYQKISKNFIYMYFFQLFKSYYVGKISQEIRLYKDIKTSVEMSKYRDELLKKFLAYEKIDSLPGKASFKKNLEILNTQAKKIKSKDIYVLNKKQCPLGYQISKPEDKLTTAKGEKYCIVLPKFNHEKVNQRYSPKTEPNSQYTSLKSCTQSYSKLVNSMIKTLNEGPIKSSEIYLKKVQASLEEIEDVIQNMEKTAKFLGSLNGGIKEVTDCRILKKDINILRSSVCHRDSGFGLRFAHQAWFFTLLGPLLCVFGVLLCFFHRLDEMEKEEKDFGDIYSTRKVRLKEGIEVTEIHL